MGGRQLGAAKDYGEILIRTFYWFTYEAGIVLNSQCRHQKGALKRVMEIAW
mgnify:CR=1 FL=1